MTPRPRLVLQMLLLFLLPWTAGAQEPTPLIVTYLERPPYYWTENGHAKGFLLELTRRILDQAGVPATYVPLPPKRILDDLRHNPAASCSIGWFRNPEREAYANFSLPIYRDKPLVLLTTKEQANLFHAHHALRDVFRDPSLIMAQVASFSYGETVDRLQKEILVRNLTVSTSQSVLPQLIAQGRASYMLVAPEEIPTLLRSARLDPDLFVELPMEDIPAGNLRYLICSKKVPQSDLARIDAAINALTNQTSLHAPDRL